MKKIIIAALMLSFLGTVALARPADTRCWWDGYYWHCRHVSHSWWWHHHHPYWRHYGWGYGPHWQGYWHP